MKTLNFLMLMAVLIGVLVTSLYAQITWLAIGSGVAILILVGCWIFFGSLGNAKPNSNNRPTIDPSSIGGS